MPISQHKRKLYFLKTVTGVAFALFAQHKWAFICGLLKYSIPVWKHKLKYKVNVYLCTDYMLWEFRRSMDKFF